MEKEKQQEVKHLIDFELITELIGEVEEVFNKHKLRFQERVFVINMIQRMLREWDDDAGQRALKAMRTESLMERLKKKDL